MARVCGGAAAAAGFISALTSAALGIDHAYASADGPFNFSPFSSSSSSSSSSSAPPQTSPESPANADQPPRVRNNNPRTTSAGFDPEALERGAKALREINSSSHAKKVFEVMKKQEETRQTELVAKGAEFKAMQAQSETV
ncbi:AAA-type ATPase family protein [Actinidia rufa]|uniref:AAA-type ATPase family protein n=1 Tax=Actinidia rufa TaxID=165716 RepID=A0A7J0EAL7_9ERIC|nr:AAA-type ATPase family protein [Actinidia rufa]